MDNLTLEEQRIVGEEESNLLKLYVYSPSKTTSENRDAILQQITELNEAIPEANSDDLPQITEQLTRLDSLMNQSDLVLEEDVVLDNPYFAHIRLREESRARDLYIGTKVYRSPDGSIQIIDWKTSPIALIYFLYDEGDEYDEEIDGRWFEGKIEIKRIVKIEDGEIVRIQQGDILLVKNRRSGWYRTEGGLHLLKGGAGTAARPENTSTVDPKLGMDRSGEIRRDKLLPEITALIDSEQFNLITQPESGIVAIQGTAGSGKTTVALHRVAWLHFRDQQRFAPNRMIVMVFNKALANYISKVLPSLGVDGVETDYFENWASDLRIRLFGGRLPKTYSEQTPVVVIRFKKHPVLLRIIDEFLRNKETTFTEKLDEIIRSRDIRDFPLQALKALPLVTRQFTLHEWIEGKSRFQDGEFPYGAETTSLLQRLIGEYIDPERSRIDMVIHYWEELFTNFEFLKERFLDLAGNDFSQTMLDEVVDWLKHNYITRYSPDPVKKRDLVDLISDGKKTADVGITLDYEDDPILLYFYQKIFKDVVRKKGAKLSYSHMMIDEVQDMSPIELSVLMNVLKSPLSLTLAGDVDQKMIEHSGFRDWDSMLSNMGLTGQKVSTLRVGYRSTFEIMEFAQVVLGELASTKDFTATRHGPPVELFQYSNQGEMVHFLSKSIKELLADEPNASVAVIGLSPEDATEYYTMLDKMEIPNLRLVSDQDFLFLPGVDVTDIKQIKGLEFDYVILLDVDRVNYPDHSYSKYLLHIASTRAAHQLWLMNRRDPSPVVPESLTKRAIH